jgi:F-type H+-transporting ATPase subunit a
VTAVLAGLVFVTVTVLGFVKNGARFLELFWVKSAPLPLRPVLAIIELISYFVRPVSHSIRLAGNIMAGHAVLKVFAGFAGALGVFAFLPVLAMVGVYALEVLVSVIQAYVFTILTCVYLKDALHPHH